MTNPAPISLDSSELKQRIVRFQQAESEIVQQVRRVIVGQEEVLEQVLIALFVGGHCLITGFPERQRRCWSAPSPRRWAGVQAHSVHARPDAVRHHRHRHHRRRSEHRTPHLDLRARARSSATSCWPTKSTVRRRRRSRRCSKRCRSAPARCAAIIYKLPAPFFVLATQNPIELEGTYPLPEAQLDRFLFNTVLDYLSAEDEMKVIDLTTTTHDRACRAGHDGRRDSRLPAAGSHGADRRFGGALCRRPRSRDAADRSDRARFREEVRQLRRQRPRRSEPGAGRQGARADAPPLSRHL